MEQTNLFTRFWDSIFSIPIFEFWREKKGGKFSNERLCRFLVMGCFVLEWIDHISRDIQYKPTWTTIAFVIIIAGFGEMLSLAKGKKLNES